MPDPSFYTFARFIVAAISWLSQAVETARRQHRYPVILGVLEQLRRHTAGLGHHDEAARLTVLAVEPEALGLLADVGEEVVDAVPPARVMAGDAVVADRRHRDTAGPARPHQQFAEVVVGPVGLVVSVAG